MIIRDGKIVRASARNGDPGYGPGIQHIDALLNGETLTGCITADADEGFVVRHTGLALGEEWAVETLHGKVEIRVKGDSEVIKVVVPRNRAD